MSQSIYQHQTAYSLPLTAEAHLSFLSGKYEHCFPLLEIKDTNMVVSRNLLHVQG